MADNNDLVPGDDHEDPVTPPAAENEGADPDSEMEGLFDDLEEETPEEIKAERDRLRQVVASMGVDLEKLQSENVKLSQKLDAQQAEGERVLARVKKQFEEQKPFVLEKFLKEVLPVIDNLERGLGAVSPEQRAADPKFDKHAQGIEKTLVQLSTVFNKFGIKAINPKGEVFDPDKHEALGLRDDDGVESDTVVEVAQKGYELNGRIIRAAKVIVKS